MSLVHMQVHRPLGQCWQRHREGPTCSSTRCRPPHWYSHYHAQLLIVFHRSRIPHSTARYQVYGARCSFYLHEGAVKSLFSFHTCMPEYVHMLQVIMEYRQTAPEHKEWATALKAFMARLQVMAKAQFPQGLTWVGSGTPGATPTSTAPPPSAPSAASTDTAPPQSMLCSLDGCCCRVPAVESTTMAPSIGFVACTKCILQVCGYPANI